MVKHVIGPDGRRLTLADLPLPDTKRWVIRRKAEVVAAVRGGLLSLEAACSRYALNSDEFLSWQQCVDRFRTRGAPHDSDSVLPKNCREAGEFGPIQEVPPASFGGRSRLPKRTPATRPIVCFAP